MQEQFRNSTLQPAGSVRLGMSEMCPQGLDSQLIDLSLAANILLRSEPLEDDEEEEDEEKDDEEDDNDQDGDDGYSE